MKALAAGTVLQQADDLSFGFELAVTREFRLGKFLLQFNQAGISTAEHRRGWQAAARCLAGLFPGGVEAGPVDAETPLRGHFNRQVQREAVSLPQVERHL